VFISLGTGPSEVFESKSCCDWSVSQSVSQCPGMKPTLGLITSCWNGAVLFLWGVLSDERTGVQFAVQSLSGPRCFTISCETPPT
jgi:hypothetical protein